MVTVNSKSISHYFTLRIKLMGLELLFGAITITSLYYLQLNKFISDNSYFAGMMISMLAYFLILFAIEVFIKKDNPKEK